MKLRVLALALFLGAGGMWGCGENEEKESPPQKTSEAETEGMLFQIGERPSLALEAPYDLEACSLARPGDCLGSPDLSATREHTVCGYPLKVPVLSYLACQGAGALMPASCTVGTALTAGGACAANIAVAAAACTVSIATIEQAAECCIKGGC